MEHKKEKTFIVDGTVTMEKSVTRKMGDDYVKITVGTTLPIDLLSTSDKELRDKILTKVTLGYNRLSKVIDAQIEEELEEFK